MLITSKDWKDPEVIQLGQISDEKDALNKIRYWAPKKAKSFTIVKKEAYNYGVCSYFNLNVKYYTRMKEGIYEIGAATLKWDFCLIYLINPA